MESKTTIELTNKELKALLRIVSFDFFTKNIEKKGSHS